MEILSDRYSMHLPRNVLFFIFALFLFPDKCISSTSLHAASISKTFGSVVNSLPQEYSSFIHPVRIFSSENVPYVPQCDDFVLIEDGKMSLCLNKASGKKCIMLSAKELYLTFDTFWQWISIPESRFDKVPELTFGVPFKIHGVMSARFLSPGTCYSAYIVYKPKDTFHDKPYLGVGLIEYRTSEGEMWQRNELTTLKEREDGWTEIEFGDFFNEGGLIDYDEIKFHIYEIDYAYWKPGFIIQGIEFRPHKSRVMGQKYGVESIGQGEGDIISGSSPFDDLPEECISHIISFTSPRDACVAASVSKCFGPAVQADSVWEKFIPVGYASFVPPASRVFSSTKDLYFALCDPFLSKNGKKSFWLDKASGKKCIMLSPKELAIAWGNSPQHWRWISIPEARFEKVAQLLSIWWFEIRGKTNTRLLSHETRYSAYIVFKTVDKCPGLADLPIEVGVGLMGQEIRKRLIYFYRSIDKHARKEKGDMRDVIDPKKREDGWMEATLGDFFNEEGYDDEIEFSVIEIRSPYWKCGLVIQGIEFRPTKSR